MLSLFRLRYMSIFGQDGMCRSQHKSYGLNLFKLSVSDIFGAVMNIYHNYWVCLNEFLRLRFRHPRFVSFIDLFIFLHVNYMSLASSPDWYLTTLRVGMFLLDISSLDLDKVHQRLFVFLTEKCIKELIDLVVNLG